ncbi:MAG: hypothetical protein SGPRY_009220, partial [Prymnesium sp.]
MVGASLGEAEMRMEGMAEEVVADILQANKPAETSEDAGRLGAKLRQFFPTLLLDDSELVGEREVVRGRVSAAAVEAVKAKVDELEGTREGLGVETIRYLTLVQTDNLWKTHMKAMQNVKDFAGLKAYANLNPLDVYRWG